MDINEIIDGLKLNKGYLANKIEMPVGTFNNKLSKVQTLYKFTDKEKKKVLCALLDMSQKISAFVNEEFGK